MLVGREAERRTVEGLLEDARAGRSGALFVHGDPGIGKSALLADARDRAGDLLVLSGAGVESETELPFAALHELLAPVLDRLDGLPPVQRSALRGAVGLAESKPADRLLIGAAVLSVLAEAAAQRHVLCLLDDAHLLDEESAAALAFAARRLGAEGIAMLITARDAPAGPLHRAGLPELRLASLGEDDASELLAERRADLDPEARELVLNAAAGNPLALLELPAAVVDRHGSAALPARLEAAYLDRTAELPEPTRELLLLVAAEDSGDVAAIVRAGSSLGVDASAFEPAERAGLVEIEGTRVAFRHPLMRSAVYGGATFEARRRAHALLAQALTEPGDADRRAWHRAAATAGADDEVAEEMLAVADRASARGANASASSGYEASADLASDPAVRADRLALAAESAWLSGAFDRCLGLLDRLREQDAPSLRALDTRLRAEIENTRGSLESAGRLLMAAARDPGTDPSEVRRLALVGAESTIRHGDLDAFREFDDLVASLPVPEEAFDRMATNVLHGVRSVMDGDARAGAPLLRAALEQGLASEDRRELFSTAVAALYLGEWSASRTLYARATARARATGEIGILALTLSGLAAVEASIGELPQADADAHGAIDLASHSGQENVTAHAHGALAVAAAWRGDERACTEEVAHALELAVPRGLAVSEGRATFALALLALGAGHLDEALERLAAITGPEHTPAIRGMALPLVVEAAARVGDEGLARTALDDLLAWAIPCDSPDVAPVALRCRALLAEDDEAEILYERALGPDADPNAIERARTKLLFGEHLRRRRRRIDARPHLRAALETFRRAGARPWEERAARELRATGETSRARNVATARELTPQELQIARLAGERSTNREIAAQLFLSPKTVEYHLGKVFAKLGVSSRTELIAVSGDVGALAR